MRSVPPEARGKVSWFQEQTGKNTEALALRSVSTPGPGGGVGMREKWRHLAVEVAACIAWRAPGAGGRDRTPRRTWRQASWSWSTGVFRRTGGVRGAAVETTTLSALLSAGMNRPRGPRRLGPFIKLVGPNPLGPFCSNQGPQRQKTYEAAAHESQRWVFTLC
jgi:hypothetical protein